MIKKFIFKQYESRIIGAIFCQVIRIKLLFHDKPSITLGNQKWKGAAPLFNNKEEAIRRFV